MSDKKNDPSAKDDPQPSLADAFICDAFPRFIICSTLVGIFAALCFAAASYPAVKAKNDAAEQARSSTSLPAARVSPSK